MRVLFFICSLLITGSLSAQDSLQAEKSRPRLYISVDYGKIATMATEFETKVEGGIGLRISRNLFLVGHAGYASLSPNNAIENGTYNATGLYYRAGMDYYFNIDPKNSLIAGARYGLTTFSEELSYTISSDLFEDITQDVERNDSQAQWAEVSLGTETALGKTERFYAGGYFSLRILISRDSFEPADVYTIPGYGRTFDKTIPAVQLYLKLAIF